MLDETSSSYEFIPFVVIGGLIIAINLHIYLRRQADRGSLEDQCGLGQRDELPADFPRSIFEKLDAWDVFDILSGIQDNDQILTFNIRKQARAFGNRSSSPAQTVVARRSNTKKPIPNLEPEIYYQQIGLWRIALKRRVVLPGFQRLRAKDIEALWKMLA